MNFQEANATLRDLTAKTNQLEGVYTQYQKQLDDLTEQLAKLDHKVLLYSKASEGIKKMLDEEVADKVEAIDKLITQGLKQVFDDLDISFRSDISDKNNRLNIDFTTVHGEIEGSAVESFGGGIVNVESFLLRVITILKLKLAPFIQLDESFNNVAVQYVPNTAKMVQAICQKAGIDVLLVSHQPMFLEHADVAYEGQLSPDGEKAQQLKFKTLKVGSA